MPRALRLVGASDFHPIGKCPDLLSDGNRGAANSVQVKTIPRRSSDLNHRNGGLWLDNSHTPATPLWLQPPQLGPWDRAAPALLRAPAAPGSSSGGQGCFGGSSRASDGDPRVSKLWTAAQCEDGQPISDAVDALTLLVGRQCHIPYTLFYRLLKRCTAEKNLALGQRIHALTVRSGYAAHAFLATHLIGLYASHGRLDEAMQVFHNVPTPDIYNWAAIIVACAKHGDPAQAIRLYRQMRASGGAVEPDNHIFSGVLKACAAAGDLNAGRDVHAHICASAWRRPPDMVVQTGLVNMYAKCGGVADARRVFDQLPRKDVVTWTAMIAGYAQQGMPHEALRLYSSMRRDPGAAATPPDAVTFLSLLQACAAVAALPLGTHLHAEIQRLGLQSHHGVGNALVHMYAKCGSMVDAHHVFDSLPAQPDEVAWGALIAGYTRHGHSEVVFELVDRMRQAGVQPNAVTLLCVLIVCCHVGLVDKGRQYFAAMSRGDYGGGVRPTIEHYTCMVDMLGRAGRLDEALQVVKNMPFPADATVWSTLLGACRTWKNVEVGKHAFEVAVRQDERNAGAYILMAGIYASAGMWEEAERIHARRVQAGACKPAGRSWTEDPKGVVHAFDMAAANPLR